jgi:5'-3' exonuclease
MGIPFYFVSLIKRHKHIVSRVRVKLEPDILAIDFNCLIHNYIDNKNPVNSVVKALEGILDETCKPRKHLYIAMDGVVPMAKIVQQRYRRFRKSDDIPEFDRHQISPGTPYMKDLKLAIQSHFPYAILSDTSEPGEGEHKIFDWLRSLSKEERRSICIYGLDADLILLSLAQRGLSFPRSFWLLRENQTFHPDDESPGFSVLNIGGLELDLPIQQYIMLSIMCFGNDFVPNLGLFSLREGGYERALDVYSKAGNPDLLSNEGRRKFLEVAGKQELAFYIEKAKQRNIFFEKCVVVADGSHFERKYNLHVQDGIEHTEKVVECYWKIVHWTYTYFTENRVLDWGFYYSYPEAPLISQLLRYNESKSITWNKSEPTNLTKHLQFILPMKSLHTAKKRCIFPDELYDEEHDTRHPWMRRYKWEAEPRISLPTEDLTTVQPWTPT